MTVNVNAAPVNDSEINISLKCQLLEGSCESLILAGACSDLLMAICLGMLLEISVFIFLSLLQL